MVTFTDGDVIVVTRDVIVRHRTTSGVGPSVQLIVPESTYRIREIFIQMSKRDLNRARKLDVTTMTKWRRDDKGVENMWRALLGDEMLFSVTEDVVNLAVSEEDGLGQGAVVGVIE